ncbi:MAG: Crp/Fnr family transcriptional regulator [Pseudomonadales bacterium]
MAVPHIGSDWINQLPPKEKQATLERMRNRRVNKGEVIYAEGQLHTALWQVKAGNVRVTNQTSDGKEVVIAIFSMGDCFGELTLLDGFPAANTATAIDHVELAELAKSDFDELYHQYPVFAHELMRLMCGRLRHMLNFYADVTLRPLEQRMASRILYITSDNPGKDNTAELRFTQQDLANMVGATRQAVSKVLNLWRDQNIISLEYGKISVLSPAELENIATS